MANELQDHLYYNQHKCSCQAASSFEGEKSFGYPFEGVDGLAVLGYTGAIGGDGSPIPSSGYPSLLTGAGSRSPQESRWVGQGDCRGGGGDGAWLVNWRPQFIARHRKHANDFAFWGSAPWLLPELKDLGQLNPELVLKAKRDYKDSLAKRSWDEKDLDFLLRTKCPGYWIMGHDDDGNRYGKELFCGREWCPVCGEKNSAMHNRRFARLLPRAMQMNGIGYFVIEWPLASRYKLRTQEALSDAGKLTRKTLKDLGFERGLSRWHWFGEKSDKYNPHLNGLVDGQYISKPRLVVIKSQLREVFNEPKLIVHYEYRKTVSEMVHTLKYITRSTFTDAKWDIPMALEIRGFHNQSWWGSGKWNGEVKWSLDDLDSEAGQEVKGMDMKAIESLEKGISPKTGGEIHWGPVLPIALLHGGEIEIELDDCVVKLKLPGLKRRSLGGGYYELEPVRAPPEIDVAEVSYYIDMEV